MDTVKIVSDNSKVSMRSVGVYHVFETNMTDLKNIKFYHVLFLLLKNEKMSLKVPVDLCVDLKLYISFLNVLLFSTLIVYGNT